MTVSEPDPSRDITQFPTSEDEEDREDREKDGQVYKLLHDVKMEGEDPIADEKYYAGKDHKTQGVHMRQHEYDVNSKGHDRESHDRYHKDEDDDREYQHDHDHEHHKGGQFAFKLKKKIPVNFLNSLKTS